MWDIQNNEAVKVWRDDKHGFPSYSVGISSRKKDGSWVNAYQEVIFRRDVEFTNGEEIIINHASPSVRAWDGGKKIVWVVMDFTYARRDQQRKAPERKMPDINYDEAFAAADDSIPF